MYSETPLGAFWFEALVYTFFEILLNAYFIPIFAIGGVIGCFAGSETERILSQVSKREP